MPDSEAASSVRASTAFSTSGRMMWSPWWACTYPRKPFTAPGSAPAAVFALAFKSAPECTACAHGRHAPLGVDI